MFGEFDIFGLYFPWLMLTALLALVATRGVCHFIAKKGLYRHIWHPPLFDLALYFIMLGLFVILVSTLRS